MGHPDGRAELPGLGAVGGEDRGRHRAGEKITAYSKLNPGRGFAAKVKEFEPGRKMTWEGGMPLGLFQGVRTFTLEPREDGSTDFTLREEFSGPLLRFIGGSIPDMTQAFEDFVAGLKARAEGSAPPPPL